MPNTELISWSRLTIPRPIVTGSISVKTCLMRGSCQSIVKLQAEVDAAERADGHQQLHERRRPGSRSRTRRADRRLRAAVEVRAQDDEQDEDHDVPDRRRDRRDREVVVGLQDAHEQAVQAEEQHDREQDLREARRQAVERPVERGAGEQRHDHAGGEDEERRDRAEDDQHDPEQRRGQPEGLFAPALLEQVGEDRHERRRQRRVGEQVADQVRDLEGDREGRGRAAGAEEARGDDFAHQAGDPRDARWRSRRSPCCAATPPPPAGGPWAADDSAASGVVDKAAIVRRSRAPGLAAPRHLSWPTSIPRRSGSCAPSASVWRTASTPRRSRPTSAAWSRSCRAATTQPPTPRTASSSARSTRPSSAAPCTATPARTRSPARPASAPASS